MLNDEDWPSLQIAEAPNSPCGNDADGQDIAGAYARCFSTADGQRVHFHLRRLAFGRVFGPEASEAMLRHAEGQKQLVAIILSLARRGESESP